MASVTARMGSGPWWREPTKDQWTAWWAAWLGWTLDSFDFTIFLLIMLPISEEFGVPLTACDGGFHDHAVVAAGRRYCLRLARRPCRAENSTDDFDLLVLGMQFHRRVFT